MDVAILHPGSMGSAVGAAVVAGGNAGRWASEGRSEATRARAEADRLEDAGTLEELAARCQVAVSVCPPEFALETATAFIDAGFQGLYVDANAISPATARLIGAEVARAGCRFVDGGIIGGPPRKPGTTRLYLSGEEAQAVASLFEGSPLEAVLVGSEPGAASAVKVCYAAWTKGSTALLLNIRALARAEGVEPDLLKEWAGSQPGLAERSERSAGSAAPKAWRWVGEMEEIADTFAAVGLPDGFHRAAARLYERLAEHRDREGVTLEDVVEALLGHGEGLEPVELRADK